MGRTDQKVRGQLERAGVTVVALAGDELQARQQQWRTQFARELHETTGLWIKDDYDWHVFSFNHRAAKTGDDARNAYRAKTEKQYLVLGSYLPKQFGFLCTGPLCDLSGPMIDATVAPTDFSWTMCSTHESQCGPYFSEAS